MDLNDNVRWRLEVNPDSRHQHADMILVSLMICFPNCASADLDELVKMATWLEEENFVDATSYDNYHSRVEIRLLRMKRDFPTTHASHGMQPQVHNQPQISLPNQSQEGQPQLLSQNVQNNNASVGDQSLTQTLVPNAGGLNMQPGITQNIVGSSVSQDLPSNNFSNTEWQMSECDQLQQISSQEQQLMRQDLLQPTQMSNTVDWSTDPQSEIVEQYWLQPQQQQEQQLMKQDLLQPTQMSNVVDRSTNTWAEKALAQYLFLEKQDEQLMEKNILQPTQMSNVVGRSTNTQSEVAHAQDLFQQQQQQHQLMNPQLVSSSMTSNAQTGQNASMTSNAPTGHNASMNSIAPIGQNASTNSNTLTGQNAVDWKEELYQKIQDMKQIFLPYLNAIHQKVTEECRQQLMGSVTGLNVPREKQKQLNTLEGHIRILNLSKDGIVHAMKDELSNYDKQLIKVITSNWAQLPVSAQQQILQPGAHPLSTQQQKQQQLPQQQPQQPQQQQKVDNQADATHEVIDVITVSD